MTIGRLSIGIVMDHALAIIRRLAHASPGVFGALFMAVVRFLFSKLEFVGLLSLSLQDPAAQLSLLERIVEGLYPRLNPPQTNTTFESRR